MAERALRSAAAPLAWTGYVAVPAAGWAWADGLPLGVVEAAAIAAVWWAWWSARQLPGRYALAALIVVKLALGAVLVDHAFLARYYANDRWEPPVERSAEFRLRDVTRHDRQLAFGGEGNQALPLFFYNDLKYNFYGGDQPERAGLPYSIAWDGWLHSGTPETTYYLAGGRGVSAELQIDDRPVLTLRDRAMAAGSVALGPGWHRIAVRVAAPQGAERRVEAGEVIDGERTPFGGRGVYVRPVGQARRAADAVARWVSAAVDLTVFTWLAALVVIRARAAWHERHVARLLWLAVIVDALVFALPHTSRVVMLSGGDDWLTYEHLARAIALGDPFLQQPGPAPGQGAPFYYQPLYPFFLAASHAVFGESLFGMALVQRLLLATGVWGVWAVTKRLFGPEAGLAALVGGGVFMYIKVGPWAGVPLAEALFTPILVCWIWLLIRAATDAPSMANMLRAGIVGGMATLTRSTLLVAWPLIVPLWTVAMRSRRLAGVSVLVSVMAVAVGLATARNWIVAETFVPVTTSFGINLHLGNEPPRTFTPPPERAALYERLLLENYTRGVAEYAFQAPGEFASGLWNKALYTLGFFRRSGLRAVHSPGLFDLSGIREAPGTSWALVLVWSAAVAGLISLARGGRLHSVAATTLPAAAALAHCAVVVMIFPNIYTDRLILPLYPLLIPYGALLAAPVARWAQGRLLSAPFAKRISSSP